MVHLQPYLDSAAIGLADSEGRLMNIGVAEN
jgi:hypothetical protein